MTRNLRAAVALVYRGGRSIGSRSFSSPASGAGSETGRGSFERSVMEILMEKPAKTNGDWMAASTVFGCACYMGLGNSLLC
ncbi:hypothetical protein AALP_AA3G003500 [Arabis alpina]|uniref:Uncharacterized protein n=1 Tax=Arabis alpina TaxID=50452 RepID=A0A087H641_ARAAL|nr:hypothetical protein AALP_AA3G003500 [Arabis alpina]